MPKLYPVDRSRRAVLGAGGALILSAALWPAEAWAQATGTAKMRIGVIGSGRIGGTIGGLCDRAGWRCEWIDERGQRCAKAAPQHRMFADHKKERQDAPDAKLDPANGWCLCGAHHSLKTAQEREKRLLKG
jgi:hypothetical protein